MKVSSAKIRPFCGQCVNALEVPLRKNPPITGGFPSQRDSNAFPCHDFIKVDSHYSDVIMGAMAYQITGISIDQPFVHAQIKENIKAPRHWPLWGESITKGQ